MARTQVPKKESSVVLSFSFLNKYEWDKAQLRPQFRCLHLKKTKQMWNQYGLIQASNPSTQEDHKFRPIPDAWQDTVLKSTIKKRMRKAFT